MTADQSDAADVAILSDNQVKPHKALDASLFGERWIDGNGLLDQITLLDFRSNTDALRPKRTRRAQPADSHAPYEAWPEPRTTPD